LFVSVYNYSIPSAKVKEFINLEKKAIKIYLEKGCSGIELYREMKDNSRWLEINRFQDIEHYNEIIKLVNSDPHIEKLYEEFLKLMSDDDASPEKKLYFRII
jgi:quinol monooxygenase YgiN